MSWKLTKIRDLTLGDIGVLLGMIGVTIGSTFGVLSVVQIQPLEIRIDALSEDCARDIREVSTRSWNVSRTSLLRFSNKSNQPLEASPWAR